MNKYEGLFVGYVIGSEEGHAMRERERQLGTNDPLMETYQYTGEVEREMERDYNKKTKPTDIDLV